MKLTQTLLGFLNEVFSRDPQKFIAFQLDYADGDMTWTVSDGFLTTVVTGGPGVGLSLDLSQYTILTLVAYLAGQAGYTVNYIDQTSNATLGALVLLDGTGGENTDGGDKLFGYTSLLYAYLEANAYELEAAEDSVAALPSQMNILNADGSTGAAGSWLDVIGGQFDVPREDGELDPVYGPRIIASVIGARGNGVAIEIALSAYTDQDSTVLNAATVVSDFGTYSGAFNFDGSHLFDSAPPVIEYNLFDVWYSYDFSVGTDDFATVYSKVAAIIETYRDAGFHPRLIHIYATLETEDGLYELETEDGLFVLTTE